MFASDRNARNSLVTQEFSVSFQGNPNRDQNNWEKNVSEDKDRKTLQVAEIERA
jgi:hypothetical protein